MKRQVMAVMLLVIATITMKVYGATPVLGLGQGGTVRINAALVSMDEEIAVETATAVADSYTIVTQDVSTAVADSYVTVTSDIASALLISTNYTDTIEASTILTCTNYTDTIAGTSLTESSNYTDSAVSANSVLSTNYADTVASASVLTSTNYTDTIEASTILTCTNYTVDSVATAYADLDTPITESAPTSRIEATGTLTMATKPLVNDTITIALGATTNAYTFVASSSGATEITIGDNVYTAQTNAIAIIEADSVVTMGIFNGSDESILTSVTVGAGGNSIATTASLQAGDDFTAGTLTGGTDMTVTDADILISTSYLYVKISAIAWRKITLESL